MQITHQTSLHVCDFIRKLHTSSDLGHVTLCGWHFSESHPLVVSSWVSHYLWVIPMTDYWRGAYMYVYLYEYGHNVYVNRTRIIKRYCWYSIMAFWIVYNKLKLINDTLKRYLQAKRYTERQNWGHHSEDMSPEPRHQWPL